VRLELLSGAMQNRSFVANAQRCVNLYVEKNAQDALTKITCYPRPGLRLIAASEAATPVRGIFCASNGNGYAVIGQSVYFIVPPQGGVFPLELIHLGFLTFPSTGPVSFVDNGIEGLLVDGGGVGWTINLANNQFALLVDPTGSFTGASRVDYIDTFILFNYVGTNRWGSTLSNEIVFDPLFIASKTSWPDPLANIVVNKHYILLIGELKSEIWYDAGGTLFPFQILPGTNIEHGTVAPASIAYSDVNTYFLSNNLQGKAMVLKISNFSATRVSNHALEFQIQQMAAAGTITDAIGMCFQQGGHPFYVLTFPTGNQTWVLDESSGEWSQWVWTDSNGGLNRWRGNCCANVYGMTLVGDHANGQIYSADMNYFLDDTATNGLPDGSSPITKIRGFPHFNVGMTQDGQPSPADGKQYQVDSFVADIECGSAPLNADGSVPQVLLRWSTDRGKTFTTGDGVLQSNGAPGEFDAQPQWSPIGQARDIIFELEWSFASGAALNGCWIEVVVLDN